MEIILLRNIPALGSEGEIVTVKAGYGRNYLIPRGWARLATRGAVRAHADQQRQQVRKRAQQRENADLLREQLDKTVLEVGVKVGEEDRIFGTVTTQQVALKLAMQGFSLDRKDIVLTDDIRLLGEYFAVIKLHADVEARVKIVVVPEEAA